MKRTAEVTPEQAEEIRRQLAAGKDPRSIVVTKTKATRKGAKLGEMNGLETDFSVLLERRRIAGEILGWWYESHRVRIAFGKKKVWVKFDFYVVGADGSRTYFETKGWWRTACRLKIKVAAGVYKYDKFIGVRKRKKKDGGGFEYEAFS